ncbi:MAG: hypothetical protein ABIY51_03140 [Ferruginibacter sp.]
MRQTLYIFSSLVFILFLASCSGPSFNTVNNMRNINGTVYMKDGTERNGQLTSTLASTFSSNSYIQFTENNKSKQKIQVADIKAVRVRNDYYEPKLIDQGFGSKDQMLFVKRITKDGSKIQLYELHEQQNRSNNSYSRYGSNNYSQLVDEYSYYVTLPNQDPYQAWNVEGKHFTPNFENKMSEYVKDCAELAEKIKRKDKGYFYAKISLVSEKRIETLMNIIDEYNRCKSEK